MSKHGNWNFKIDADADTGEIVRARLSIDLVPAKPTREDALRKIAAVALYLADNPGLMKDHRGSTPTPPGPQVPSIGRSQLPWVGWW
ncbi:hypothetical protein PBI_RUOTULA_81 [Mycobacterium phage Ruotula]|nr:hypothetical protein PBI_RUOTULA_81 [Mycobacterium phage Ruotula]